MDVNFAYIESAVLLNIENLEDFKKIKFSRKDFSVFGDAFEFIRNYFDENRSLPPRNLLYKQFPSTETKVGLDPNSVGISLDYSLEQFKEQVLFRQIVSSFKDNEKLLKESPEKALLNISSRIDDIQTTSQDDIVIFDSKSNNRLLEYEERREQRKKGLGILGIPTIFRSINGMGVGHLPGEMTTFFARPSVGKSWICCKAAAIAVKSGFRTLLITTEMPAKQMNLRLDVVFGNMLGYNFSHNGLRSGNLISQEEKEYKKYLLEVDSKNLLVADHLEKESFNVNGIKSLISKYNPSFVIIDAIQLFSGSERAISEKMVNLFYGIKNICMARNISSIITTQANRGASDMFLPPTSSDVWYGDGAFQSSDLLFSVCLVENSTDRLVQWQKSRDGNPKFKQSEIPGNVTFLKWNIDRGVIEEKPDEEF